MKVYFIRYENGSYYAGITPGGRVKSVLGITDAHLFPPQEIYEAEVVIGQHGGRLMKADLVGIAPVKD